MTISPHPLPAGEGVRIARVEGAEGIAYIHVTAWQETYRRLMPDSVLDTLSIERRAKQWKHSLEDSSDTYHQVFVAEDGGKIVGFANCGKEREGDSEYQGELYALYVLKQFHGQGIGRVLVQKSAEELLAMQITSMLVWVLTGNPAQKFYEHIGVYLREKSFEMEGGTLMERAYGWRNIRLLAEGKG